MKRLNIHELTTEQKIGQLLIICSSSYSRNREQAHQMLREKRLGGVQIPYSIEGGVRHEADLVCELAGYPVLIANDMEGGCPGGEYRIPSMMALGMTGDEELAYQVGAVTAIEAKKMGYNTVWGPVVDLLDGYGAFRVTRCLGEDPLFVGKMATAMLRGFHDNGMVTTAKHWPAPTDMREDGHMFAVESAFDAGELLEKTFSPYKYIMEQGELTGIMTTHTYCPAVDGEYPGTLSEKMVSIPRQQGFDGIIMTDSLGMTGLLKKYGKENCEGLAIRAGHDMLLIDGMSPEEAFGYLMRSFEEGVFTEERLDEAVRRVLAAQERTLKPATATEVSDYQKACFDRIAKEGMGVVTAPDVSISLHTDARKLFVILVENLYHDQEGNVCESAVGGAVGIKEFRAIKEMILAWYPDSVVVLMDRLPTHSSIYRACKFATEVDEVIFVTNALLKAYGGSEDLTDHVLNCMRAIGDKLSAVIHLGNPFAAERMPYTPRLILSTGARCLEDTVEYALAILSGEETPAGRELPIRLNLKGREEKRNV